MNILIGGSLESCTGQEELEIANGIKTALVKQGHTVDSFMLPFEPDFQAIPEQIAALQLFALESTDLLITVGYPAMFLPHPRKSVYLLKTAPMAHEYWGTQYGTLDNPSFYRIKVAIHEAEQKYLKQVRTIVCGSQLLQRDLIERYGISSTVGYYPANMGVTGLDDDLSDSPYVVAESDLTPPSRMELLIDTVKTSRGNWNLKWFVPNALNVYKDALIELITKNSLQNRIQVCSGQCTPVAMQKSVAYINLSYETHKIPSSFMRALACSTEVLIPRDSGALLELAEGTFAPSPYEMSQALDNICQKPKTPQQIHTDRTTSFDELAKRLVSGK